MKEFYKFLQEDNGNLSSIRLYSLVVVGCMAIDWLHAVFAVGRWSPDVATIGLVLGTITAKVAQKPFEQKP